MDRFSAKEQKDFQPSIPYYKQHDLPYNSFVGGWYIDEQLCDKIVEFYNTNKSQAIPGATFKKDERSVDESIKSSLDLPMRTETILPWPMNEYFKELQICLVNYLRKYRQAENVERFDVEKYNIQYYKPGGGFKRWHCERTGKHDSERHLVFMTYLNDVPDGGTAFLYQDLELEAKKGLTVIWPSDWTHTHKGIISDTHEKYIVTGWFNYL